MILWPNKDGDHGGQGQGGSAEGMQAGSESLQISLHCGRPLLHHGAALPSWLGMAGHTHALVISTNTAVRGALHQCWVGWPGRNILQTAQEDVNRSAGALQSGLCIQRSHTDSPHAEIPLPSLFSFNLLFLKWFLK